MHYPGKYRFLLIVIGIMASHNAWAILAIDDNYVVPQDSPGYLINPLSNDIVDFDSLTLPSADDFTLQAGSGTIEVTQSSISIVPAPGFVGSLEFTYSITDNSGTDVARIVADVQAAPATFEAVDDFHHVLENDFAIPFDVLANDNIDPVNGALIIATSTTAQGGTVSIDTGGQFLSYQPPTNFTGEDTFTYDLQDQATSAISQATVTVYVGIDPGENPPLASATDEEQEVIDTVDQICNSDPNGPLPCALIATLTDDERRRLARQVGGRHAKAQSRAVRQIKNRQSTNVRSRLSEIRGQRNRVSVNKLNTAMFNHDVPLGRAFQSMLNQQLSGGSAGDGDFDTPWGFFINGNISIGEGSGPSDRPQYEQDGMNVTTGADYRLSDKLVVGGALGFSQSDLEFSFDRGTQTSDSYTLSVFGNYYPWKNLYIDFLAMWVNADIDIDRRISISTFTQSLTSNTSSRQTVAATSFGYDFAVKAWQGSLYARAEYSDLTIDAYTESGSGGFELAVGEQQSDSVDLAFGGRLAYTFPMRRGVFIPSLEVESVSQGEEDYTIESRFAQVASSPRISLDAAEQDDTYYNASLSLSAVWASGKSGFFRYESLLGNDEYKSDTYSLGFRIEF